jgi:hypothetical protein
MIRLGIPLSRMLDSLFIMILLAIPLGSFAQVTTTATVPLRLVQTIPLPGVAGFLGAMSVDSAGQRLFLAATGNSSVEIIDLRAGQRVAAIANLAQPEGILFEKVSRRLFVSCSGDGTCKAFSAAEGFPLLASIPVGGNPSLLRYAPAVRQVLDPSLTVGLPRAITADTGMDALTHAVEAYLTRGVSKRCQRLSEDAVRLIFANLQRAYRSGADIDARMNMLLASFYAGDSFTRAGLTYVHPIAHTLGGLYGTPHGRANAVILP